MSDPVAAESILTAPGFGSERAKEQKDRETSDRAGCAGYSRWSSCERGLRVPSAGWHHRATVAVTRGIASRI
jgi:hypothetical protein